MMTHFTPCGLGAKSALRLRVGHTRLREARFGGRREVGPAGGPVYASGYVSGPGGPICAHDFAPMIMGHYQRSVVLAGRGYSAPAARAVASAWRRRMVSGQRDLM